MFNRYVDIRVLSTKKLRLVGEARRKFHHHSVIYISVLVEYLRSVRFVTLSGLVPISRMARLQLKET